MYSIYRYIQNGRLYYSKMLISGKMLKDNMVTLLADNNIELIIIPPTSFATLLLISEKPGSYFH